MLKLNFCYAGILGIFYLVLSQPALAEVKQTKIDIGKDKASVEQKTEKSISNILQLDEIQLPKTSASYLPCFPELILDLSKIFPCGNSSAYLRAKLREPPR